MYRQAAISPFIVFHLPTRTTWFLTRDSTALILEKDSEIHAGQVLLKKEFPFIDGLQDPAVKGSLVIPATSEFVQIIDVGKHWVCISTIGCQAGIVKIFDSLYSKPNSVLIDPKRKTKRY